MWNFFRHYIAVLRYLFKRKVTLNVNECNARPDKFKGQIVVDNRKCLKCKTCEKSCINGCIKVDDKFKIDYQSCCFCGRCVESCPVKAITVLTNDACGVINKDDLIQRMEKGG